MRRAGYVSALCFGRELTLGATVNGMSKHVTQGQAKIELEQVCIVQTKTVVC
jgi:hypothetical protein